MIFGCGEDFFYQKDIFNVFMINDPMKSFTLNFSRSTIILCFALLILPMIAYTQRNLDDVPLAKKHADQSLFSSSPKLQIQPSFSLLGDSIYFHPKGAYIITGSVLWDIPSATAISYLANFCCFRFDTSGIFLVGLDTTKNISIAWSLETGEVCAYQTIENNQFPTFTNITYTSSAVLLTNEAEIDRTPEEIIKQYPLRKIYSKDRSLVAKTSIPTSLIMNSNLANHSSDSLLESLGKVSIFDATTDQLLANLDGLGAFSSIAFSPNNQFLITKAAMNDLSFINSDRLLVPNISIWNIQEEKRVVKIELYNRPINKIKWEEAGVLIVNESIVLDLAQRNAGYSDFLAMRRVGKTFSESSVVFQKKNIAPLFSPDSMSEDNITAYYENELNVLTQTFERLSATYKGQGDKIQNILEWYEIQLGKLQGEAQSQFMMSSLSNDMDAELAAMMQYLGDLAHKTYSSPNETVLGKETKSQASDVFFFSDDLYFSYAGSDIHTWQKNGVNYQLTNRLQDHAYNIDALLIHKPSRKIISLATAPGELINPYDTLGAGLVRFDSLLTEQYKTFYSPSNKSELMVWEEAEKADSEAPRLLSQHHYQADELLDAHFLDENHVLLLVQIQETPTVSMIQLSTGELKKSFPFRGADYQQMLYVPESDQLILWGEDNLYLSEKSKWGSGRLHRTPSPIISVFHPQKNQMSITHKDGMLRVYQMDDFSILHEVQLDKYGILASSFQNERGILASVNLLGEISFFNIGENKRLFKLLLGTDNSNHWLMFSEEGYYMSSQNKGPKNVKLILGNKGYDYNQFDMIFNRPDKAYEANPFLEDAFIEPLYAAYQKRLKLLDQNVEVSTPSSWNTTPIPELVITNAGSLILSSINKHIEIQLEILHKEEDSLLIEGFENHIRIYKKMQSVNANNPHLFKIPIELTIGRNKIEFSAITSQGIESLKATTYITYDAPERKPDLYLITIGVADYQAADKDLKYAAKDAQDIAALYQDQEAFAQVHTRTLTDAQATKENILALKDWLNESQVDDQVLIFVSGHGMLDQNYDFYYGTQDIDFANPSDRGILYDDIEGLLDGIPARKKLLLMDACHSGEYDADTQALTQAQQDSLKAKGIAYKGFSKTGDETPPVLGLQNSFEMMKQLFADLRRGSGATVISSSSGMQFSYEDSEWQNGAFTYVFLRGLKTMEADANGDGAVTASEIQAYVAEFVPRVTEGLQVPTFRRENLEYDFRVW